MFMVCFGDPLTDYVTQIFTTNKKATINLLQLLLGFKSILYLSPSTQHTQTCVFINITVQDWYFFNLRPLEIYGQERGPSEKLGSHIKEHV